MAYIEGGREKEILRERDRTIIGRQRDRGRKTKAGRKSDREESGLERLPLASTLLNELLSILSPICFNYKLYYCDVM